MICPRSLWSVVTRCTAINIIIVITRVNPITRNHFLSIIIFSITVSRRNSSMMISVVGFYTIMFTIVMSRRDSSIILSMVGLYTIRVSLSMSRSTSSIRIRIER